MIKTKLKNKKKNKTPILPSIIKERKLFKKKSLLRLLDKVYKIKNLRNKKQNQWIPFKKNLWNKNYEIA